MTSGHPHDATSRFCIDDSSSIELQLAVAFWPKLAGSVVARIPGEHLVSIQAGVGKAKWEAGLGGFGENCFGGDFVPDVTMRTLPEFEESTFERLGMTLDSSLNLQTVKD